MKKRVWDNLFKDSEVADHGDSIDWFSIMRDSDGTWSVLKNGSVYRSGLTKGRATRERNRLASRARGR
jgi:hypothetical protein